MKCLKTETRFCKWMSNDYNDTDIFLSRENSCTFFLAKEKAWKSIFNNNSDLSQNLREKQIILFKATVNWLSNDIWWYLVIGWFYWKIGVFQQTVVRVYCILNRKSKCDSNATQKDKIVIENNNIKAIMSSPRAWDKDQKKNIRFSLHFLDRKT